MPQGGECVEYSMRFMHYCHRTDRQTQAMRRNEAKMECGVCMGVRAAYTMVAFGQSVGRCIHFG